MKQSLRSMLYATLAAALGFTAVAHAQTASFTILASPNPLLHQTLNVAPGGVVQGTFQVVPANGFQSTVTMSLTGTPTPGISASLNISTIPYPYSTITTATITVGPNVAEGTYVVAVEGKATVSGSQQQEFADLLIVVGSNPPSYSLLASPNPIMRQELTVPAGGGTVHGTFSVVPLYGFDATVTINNTGTIPTGITATLSGGPLSFPYSSVDTITIVVSGSVAAGTYAIPVIGTAPGYPMPQFADVVVVVQ
jgi:hypothetical protein